MTQTAFASGRWSVTHEGRSALHAGVMAAMAGVRLTQPVFADL